MNEVAKARVKRCKGKEAIVVSLLRLCYFAFSHMYLRGPLSYIRTSQLCPSGESATVGVISTEHHKKSKHPLSSSFKNDVKIIVSLVCKI